jgi:hypothetical protein
MLDALAKKVAVLKDSQDTGVAGRQRVRLNSSGIPCYL